MIPHAVHIYFEVSELTIEAIIAASYIVLSKLSKSGLLKVLQTLRDKYIELEEKINEASGGKFKTQGSAYKSEN